MWTRSSTTRIGTATRPRQRETPSAATASQSRPTAASVSTRPWRGFRRRASVRRRFPALEHRRLPIGADEPRIIHPGPQLRLGEFAVDLLQRDPVGVAGLEVLDQELSRDLVLASLGN